MALSVSVLEDGLRKLRSPSFPLSLEQAVRLIAEAYHTYAQDAAALSAGVTSASLVLEKLSEPLRAGLRSRGTTSDLANAFSGALTAYWTGATFQGADGSTGVAIAPTGTAVLATALTALASTRQPFDTFVTQLAAALNVCTRTVGVTVTSPAGVVTLSSAV